MSMSDDEVAAIAEIHEQDVAEVRALLQAAVRDAGARWLPMNAIADAMVRELVVLRGRAPCVLRRDEAYQTWVVKRLAKRS
jgi:hypothetical protein